MILQKPLQVCYSWKYIVGGKELKQEENYPTPEESYEKFSDFKL